MLKIKELRKPNIYKDFVGTSFSHSEQIRHPIFGLQDHSKTIWIIDGEIQYANLTKDNISITHDIYKDIDIYKDKSEKWDIVEDILSSFLDLSKHDYELILDCLDYDSIGFKLAEKVLDKKINNLSKQLVELNSIKENANIFNPNKEESRKLRKKKRRD